MWVILVDMRENGGGVVPIVEGVQEEFATFSTIEDVKKLVLEHPLCRRFPNIALNIDTFEVENF
jgi:hypothetical protein